VKNILFSIIVCLGIIASLIGAGMTAAEAESSSNANLDLLMDGYPIISEIPADWSYDLHITNMGDIPVENVTLTDELPPDVLFIAASDKGSFSENMVVWNLGTIGPYETRFVQVFVEILWSDENILINHAVVTTTTPESDYENNGKDAITTLIHPYSDTDVNPSLNQIPPGGDNITINVNVGNYGDVPLSDINVHLNIQPPGTEYFLDNSSIYFAGNDTNNDQILDPGESWSWSISTFLDENAIVLAESHALDILGGDVYSQDSLILGSDLEIYKSGPQLAVQGSEITYTLYYSNWGTLTAENVTIIDSLPLEVDFVSASNSGIFEGGKVTWNAGSVDNMSYNSVTVTVKIADNASVDSQVVNNAEISTPMTECNISNNFSSAISIVTGGTNLGLSQNAPVSAEQGSNLTYTIFYTNTGSNPAENVLITDFFPAEVEYISASDNGSCTYGFVTWILNKIEGMSNGYVTLTAHIKNDVQTGTVITNICSIKTTTLEANYTDNVADADTTVTDNTTNFRIIGGKLPDGDAGAVYPVQTLAADNGVGPYTWSIKNGTRLPAGLKLKADKLNTSVATISGKPGKAVDNFTFIVQVKDKTTKDVAEKEFKVHINPAVTLSAPKVPTGEVDIAFPSWIPQASGGEGQYTWLISKGTLPEGLQLDYSTGVIFGTPVASGSKSITLTVTDSLGGSAGKALTLKVLKKLEITTDALPDGEVMVPYKTTLKTRGGTGNYTWSITGSLPNGLDLIKGSIKGTPTGDIIENSSIYSNEGGTEIPGGGGGGFTVKVNDGLGVAEKYFSITIFVPPFISTTPPIPENAAVGDNCIFTLLAAGGSGREYKWTILGSLPAGLKLVAGTKDEKVAWSISGILKKAGAFKFKIKLTDSLKGSTIKPVSITVIAP
jgi:uncharacterized repeat protein (TIGR01451 family)